MTENKVMGSGITRRTFVGGAAAMAALGVLGGCSATTAGKAADSGLVAVSDQVMSGVCRGGCATHCGLDVHVRDGQVVRTKAAQLSDPRYNRICSKGMTHAARVYSGERLQYPMRRIGERGEGEFERISWDEAIDEIAQKWTEYAETFGPASILIATNSGNCGMIKASITTRMQNVLGMGMLNGCYDQALSYAANKVTGLERLRAAERDRRLAQCQDVHMLGRRYDDIHTAEHALHTGREGERSQIHSHRHDVQRQRRQGRQVHRRAAFH